MRSCSSGLLVTLLLAGTSAAADPGGVVVEVEAGMHERRDTPIVFPLPESLKDAHVLSLERLDDHKAVAVQRVRGRAPMAAWILDYPLPAGSKRRYRLTPGVATSREDRLRVGSSPDRLKAGFGLAEDGDTLSVEVDGRPLLKYHSAVVEPPEGIEPFYRRSGFIHPLATRSGLAVTDDFPPDHAHQHGLFFAWVNTTFAGRRVDFWNQQERTGRVGHHSGPEMNSGPVVASFDVRLRHDDLSAPGGPEPALDETWTVRVYNVLGCVLVDFESEQECVGPEPLKVNKYHYGGMGLRGNRQWFDPSVRGDAPPDPARSGRSDFLTSEGRHRADGNHTRPRWVDLSGQVDGRFAGVAVLDHPSNFRFPQPVRLHPNKPYFCFAPMVLGDFEIAPGRPYISRYRLLVHDGPPDPEAIEQAWSDYAEPPRVHVVEGGR